MDASSRFETAATSSMLMKELPITTSLLPFCTAVFEFSPTPPTLLCYVSLTFIYLLCVTSVSQRENILQVNPGNGKLPWTPTWREYERIIRKRFVGIQSNSLCLCANAGDSLESMR